MNNRTVPSINGYQAISKRRTFDMEDRCSYVHFRKPSSSIYLIAEIYICESVITKNVNWGTGTWTQRSILRGSFWKEKGSNEISNKYCSLNHNFKDPVSALQEMIEVVGDVIEVMRGY
jgi:hypothetical protein